MKIALAFESEKWCPGDPVILRGIHNLLPKLKQNHELHYFGVDSNHFETGTGETGDVLPGPVQLEQAKRCDYLIKMGTPAWLGKLDTELYKQWIANNKQMSLIGVGGSCGFMGKHDEQETIKTLCKYLNDGYINLWTVRSQTTYNFIIMCGADPDKVHIVPCPGYFFLSPCEPVKDKKVVALDILDPHHNALVKPQNQFPYDYCCTFYKYAEKIKYIYDSLTQSGVNVKLCCHLHLCTDQHYASPVPNYTWIRENDKRTANFKNLVREFFPDKEIYWFRYQEQFENFYKNIDVYIGGRLHGALPCAGIGKPTFGLGIDNRQWAWEQVPYISRLDIRYGHWTPTVVTDWFHSLNAKNVSESMLAYRNKAETKYKKLLELVPV